MSTFVNRAVTEAIQFTEGYILVRLDNIYGQFLVKMITFRYKVE